MNRLLMAVTAAAMLAGGIAHAQEVTPEQQAQAQDYFQKGDTAYNLGRYDEAVEWFTKAYEVWQLNEFLYNIAQSYRLAGNCKQALHFYKRFRSLKERDTEAPLSKKKREEVDRFINELTECAAKADTSAQSQPDTLDKPPSGDKPPAGDKPPSGAQPPSGDEPTGDQVAVVDDTDDTDDTDDDLSLSDEAAGPSVVSARVATGLAVFSQGDLEVPAQASLAVTAGYPLAAGPIVLDLGAGVTYSPMPYDTMAGSQTGTLLGLRAVVAATYPATDKIGVRGELGFGITKFSGLVDGNPFTADRTAASFTLPSVRVGVAADYSITSNILATLSPFGITLNSGNDEMFSGSLREINVLVGVGYRM